MGGRYPRPVAPALAGSTAGREDIRASRHHDGSERNDPGGGAAPGHRPEGIDLIPILRGDSALADRRLFWRIARPNRQQRAVRDGRWKLLVDGGQFLLFDLRADPGEKHDLTAQRPELVVKLKTLLEAWEKDVNQKPQANQ